MEIWTSAADAAHRFPEIAQRAEQEGWTGITTVDSQNLAQDPYVCLALGVQATDQLKVMTSVTNTVTRAPAVTAGAAMTVQALSRGRMVLGIGRGDSALAHLGRAPTRLKWFERYLKSLQTYLRGEFVPFDETLLPGESSKPVETLDLADRPDASAITWAGNVSKVPVEIASTGAKVIGIAARHADRIMFALGAEVERLKWGIETARASAKEAGRDPDSLLFGAYVNLVCHEDLEIARRLGRSGTSLFARFSVMHGKVSGPASESEQAVFNNVHDRYDMNKHAQADGAQTTALTDDFMDHFAIIGSAELCVERLKAVEALGISKVSISGPNFRAQTDEGREAAQNFVQLVMPEVS